MSPCHYVLHDAAGNCAVIEYVDGKRSIHDNPLGVFTNAPTFDWHITNLRNYANLSVTNVPPVELVGVRLSGFGQGNGLFGLPGDFTPPSRFVRAVAFSQSSVATKTAVDAILQAFHILNQFDIPKGIDWGRGGAGTIKIQTANASPAPRKFSPNSIRCQAFIANRSIVARPIAVLPITLVSCQRKCSCQ